MSLNVVSKLREGYLNGLESLNDVGKLLFMVWRLAACLAEGILT